MALYGSIDSQIGLVGTTRPTTKPTLILDFVNSKKVDSRINFTRTTLATYYDKDGILRYAPANSPRIDFDPSTGECKGLLVEEQRTNLAMNSNDFSGSAWNLSAMNVQQNTAVSPDGTMSGDKLIGAANAVASRAVGLTSGGVTYTATIYAKAAERTSFYMYTNANNGNWAAGIFNLSAGTSSTTGAFITSTSITQVGNGWYRCSMTFTTGSSGQELRYVQFVDSGAISDGIYAWGAQLEASAFATSYIPSTDTFTSRASSASYFDSTGTLRYAGVNQPRYGYGYDTASGKWVSQGLVLEAAATNLVTYSEQFDNSAWTKYGSVTVTANNAVAPNGAQTADSLSMGASSGTYNPITPTVGATYVWSVWLKSSAGSTVDVIMNTNLGDPVYTRVVLTSLWQRVYVTKTIATGSTVLSAQISSVGGTATFDMWGAQLETGYVPTSYIPTYSASATRAADVSSSAQTTRGADVALMTSNNFTSWYRADEGSFYREFTVNEDGKGSPSGIYCTGVNDESGNNRMHMRMVRDLTNPYLDALGSANGVSQFDTDNPSAPNPLAGTLIKQQFAYKNNDVITGYNNTQLYGDTSVTIPNVTTFQLFSRTESINTGGGSGHIRKIVYYPKRLSNTELQALTQ